MSGVMFTVVIPSHAHGRLLELAGRSVLRQTVADLELFVVLDGADEPTRAAALALAGSDDRVRVFDNPKGERVGEAHRAAALEQANGRFVAYLSDDDLWLPDHLDHLAGCLAGSDFVAAQTVFHDPKGGVRIVPGDLGSEKFRSRLLMDPPWNFIGLSQGSHTLAAYRSLERGWHPAPEGVPADLHMWRHFLERTDLTARSADQTTVFTFPSPLRRHMSLGERVMEMQHWAAVVDDSERRNAFLLGPVAASLRDELGRLAGAKAELERRGAELETELARSRSATDEVRARLHAVEGSLAHRAARRLATIPVIGWVGRRVARVIVGRSGWRP